MTTKLIQANKLKEQMQKVEIDMRAYNFGNNFYVKNMEYIRKQIRGWWDVPLSGFPEDGQKILLRTGSGNFLDKNNIPDVEDQINKIISELKSAGYQAKLVIEENNNTFRPYVNVKLD